MEKESLILSDKIVNANVEQLDQTLRETKNVIAHCISTKDWDNLALYRNWMMNDLGPLLRGVIQEQNQKNGK
ncbi:hypothetical protein HC823_01480 [Candidatus Gracilibacteria bacterium]|nr:hypothetical protein [Candidatus Gracilibacteria bacterium]